MKDPGAFEFDRRCLHTYKKNINTARRGSANKASIMMK